MDKDGSGAVNFEELGKFQARESSGDSTLKKAFDKVKLDLDEKKEAMTLPDAVRTGTEQLKPSVIRAATVSTDKKNMMYSVSDMKKKLTEKLEGPIAQCESDIFDALRASADWDGDTQFKWNKEEMQKSF